MKRDTENRMKTRGLVIFLILCTVHVVSSDRYIYSSIDSLYDAYSAIDKAMKSDPKIVFQLEQAFFPSMNFRYWQVDGVEVIPINVTVTLLDQPSSKIVCNSTSDGTAGTAENLMKTTSLWSFQWSNSLLMNNIPGDVLLAMDPVMTAFVVSNIVGSFSHRLVVLNVNINRSSLFCTLSADSFEQALALVLSRSKFEIQSQPHEIYQGYISRLYSYYATDSYFDKLATAKTNTVQTQTSLWITFGFLNTLIPILCITRGRKLVDKLRKHTASKSRVFTTVVIAMTLYNAMYLLVAVVIHRGGLPNVLECYFNIARHPCRIPRSASFYSHVLGILITKGVILPTAFMVELAVAFFATKGASSRAVKTKIIFLARVIATWQLFIFIQITVGLMSIPLVVLMFISPATTLMLTGGGILIGAFLIYLSTIVPCPTTKSVRVSHCLKSTMFVIEAFFTIITISSICYSHYIIVKEGINMSGMKGYAISLLPSLPITTIIWVATKQYRKKRAKANKRRTNQLSPMLAQRSRSISTEEEIMNFSEDSM